MQLEDIITELRVKHRRRCHAMESRKILDLRMGSLLRLELGWRKDLPEKERKAIAAKASELMDSEEAHKQSKRPYKLMEKKAERVMSKLAKQLPVWESFGNDVRGFGAVSLAVVVAEAGDLSAYANPGKLWKRFGLAPGQNRVPTNLSREARAEAWIERGYSPMRRSRMWNIGDALIKVNQDGLYRTLYLQRKEYEHARDPEISKMHAHRRAQRYMEKRLLRDLWQAWRVAEADVKPKPALPSPEIQETKMRMNPIAPVSPEQAAMFKVKSKGLAPPAHFQE